MTSPTPEDQRAARLEADRMATVDTSIDEEGRTDRTLMGWQGWLFAGVAVAFSCFHLYTAFFGSLPHMQQRATHGLFGVVLAIAFFSLRTGTARVRATLPWYDWGLILCAILPMGYVLLFWQDMFRARLFPEPYHLLLTVMAVGVFLEACRRVLGWSLVILAGLALAYAMLGHLIPGTWGHAGFSPERMASRLFMADSGLWGMLPGLSATVISIFILFGLIVMGTGGGQAFMNAALVLAGRQVGGAAKVATVGSSLMGTISGSGMANAAATGSLTIPMMRRLGYRREFAVGVEATASTGGQLMPPIMGAGAFVMAEIVGIPYLTIVVAAIIPAILFYLGNFWVIHLSARKEGIAPVPADQIPSARATFTIMFFLQLILPIGLMIYFLLSGYSIAYAGSQAVLATLIVFFFINWEHSLKEKCLIFVEILRKAGISLAMMAVLAFVAQITVSMISATGIGVKFTDMMVSFGGQSLFLVLVMAMLACIILGMGMPTTAAYVLSASLAAPALIALDVPPLHAHLFAFYFAILATITPPVCTAIYAAAAIAEIRWTRAVVDTMKLGWVAFTIPFMFVYSPQLLMEGTAVEIIVVGVVKAVGVLALATATINYFATGLTLTQRLMAFAGAFLLITPGWETNIVGLILTLLAMTLNLRAYRAEATRDATPG
ncbi:TRAP transporter permease [Roseinatronobacter monicus]|uniref:TRAP transporter permease n=1 Tax=Roseinatronobacter monicus TaxID=393481 RepID=UPI003F3BEEA2